MAPLRRNRPRADVARGRPEWWILISSVVAIVVIGRAVGDVRGDFVPLSDVAIFETRAYDVFSRHPPLVGMLSSASDAGSPLYHPGPILFWLMAVPVRLLDRGRGLALGMAVLNASCLVATAWAGRRFLDRTSAAVVALGTAAFVWSLGPNLLHEAWLPHASLAPFLLFLVCCWGVACGCDALAPMLVVAFSLTGQIHGSSFAVAALVLVTVVAVRVVVGRGRVPRSWAIGGVVGLALWLPPIVQQIGGRGRGNLLALAGGGDPDRADLGAEVAVRVVSRVLAAPPWWLPAGFSSAFPMFSGIDAAGGPDLAGWSFANALVGLAAVIAVFAVLLDRAVHRGDRPVVAGAAVALVSIAASLVVVAVLPILPLLGFMVHTVRWLWPLAVWASMVVGAALVRWLAAGTRVELALAATGVVVGVAAASSAEHDVGPTAFWRGYADDVLAVRRLVHEWSPDGPVVVRHDPDLLLNPFSDAIVAQLAADGRAYLVDEPTSMAQVAPEHHGSEAAVWVIYGGAGSPPDRAGIEVLHVAAALDVAVGDSPIEQGWFVVAERVR